MNSIKKRFYKTGELNGSSYKKIALGSSALINFKNDDKSCFIWSILAKLDPCENGHPDRVSNYTEYFDGINIGGFSFLDGFRCSDVQKFEKLNCLSVNIFKLNFYHDQNKWRHNLIPVEISKND